MNRALINDNGEIYDILSGTFLVAGVNSNGELTSIPVNSLKSISIDMKFSTCLLKAMMEVYSR